MLHYTLKYRPGLINPKASVTIKEKKFQLVEGRLFTITADKGEYDLLFKVGIKSKKYHLCLNGNVHIEVKWDTFWGKIIIDEIVDHVVL